MSKYIHVVEINLNIDIEEEIRKEVGILSFETKEKIANAIALNRPTKDQMLIERLERFKSLFDILSACGAISKDDLASHFDVESKNIGPSIQKFKKYLIEYKPEWSLVNRIMKGTKVYELVSS